MNSRSTRSPGRRRVNSRWREGAQARRWGAGGRGHRLGFWRSRLLRPIPRLRSDPGFPGSIAGAWHELYLLLRMPAENPRPVPSSSDFCLSDGPGPSSFSMIPHRRQPSATRRRERTMLRITGSGTRRGRVERGMASGDHRARRERKGETGLFPARLRVRFRPIARGAVTAGGVAASVHCSAGRRRGQPLDPDLGRHFVAQRVLAVADRMRNGPLNGSAAQRREVARRGASPKSST